MEQIILSEEQSKAAEYNNVGAFAIKGIAGSGKTTVGLKRYEFLKNKCYNGESILIITFQKVLKDYLKHIVEQTIGKSGEINFATSSTLDVQNIDSLVYKKYMDFRRGHKNTSDKIFNNLPKSCETDDKVLKAILKDTVLEVRKNYPKLELLDPTNTNIDFLKDEIDYINQCRIQSSKEYQIFTRQGRNKFSDNRRNLPNKSKVREAIFRIRNKYGTTLLKKGKIDFHMMRRIAVLEVRDNPPQKYTHIIVDECQDLDRTRLDFLKYFINPNETATATFLYDNTQSIYSGSWLGGGHSFASLGINIKGKSKILKTNFRTTLEIQKAAQSLLNSHDAFTQEVEPNLINKSGVKPRWAKCKDYEHQINYITDLVNTHQKNFNLKDIIIATHSNQEVTNLYRKLETAGIKCSIITGGNSSFKHNTVRIMTLHNTKGLESEVVILANLTANNEINKFEDELALIKELKLLYVGMTRATKHLYLTSYGNPSSLISNICQSTIDLVDFENYENFEPIEDPKQQEQLRLLLTRLEKNIIKYGEIKNKEHTDFVTFTREMILTSYEMEQIQQELDDLKSQIPANTVSHTTLEGLYKVCKEQLSLAEEKINKSIKPPISYIEIEDDISKRFPSFSEKSLKTLSSAEFLIRASANQYANKDLDWALQLTAFSKVIEIELEKLFKHMNFQLYETETRNKYPKRTKKTLSGILKELEKQGGPYKDIYEELESVNFRMKRNNGTHSQILKENEVRPIRGILLKEDGVFERINKILA